MPIHIEELATEVTLVEGDLPLTHAQLCKIADFVIARLDQRERERTQARAATSLRPFSEPGPPGSEAVS